MSRQLFFVAILIPEPGASAIRHIQETISSRFDSHAALRSPPHITLVAPFAAQSEDAGDITRYIRDSRSIVPPLHNVTLDGFDVFDKRVIFVHVVPDEVLAMLAGILSQNLQQAGYAVKIESRKYHPHVTVAFKDLMPGMFPRALEYIKGIDFHFEFQVVGIALLVHSGGRWVVHEVAQNNA